MQCLCAHRHGGLAWTKKKRKKEKKTVESGCAEVAGSLEVAIHLEAVEVSGRAMENEFVFVL